MMSKIGTIDLVLFHFDTETVHTECSAASRAIKRCTFFVLYAHNPPC